MKIVKKEQYTLETVTQTLELVRSMSSMLMRYNEQCLAIYSKLMIIIITHKRKQVSRVEQTKMKVDRQFKSLHTCSGRILCLYKLLVVVWTYAMRARGQYAKGDIDYINIDITASQTPP